jgi:hypothetical protein
MRKSLRALDPPSLDVVTICYLDSVGILASLGNRLVLNLAMPKRFTFWNNVLVLLSAVLDTLTRDWLGKSVLGGWGKPLVV